MLTPTLSQFFRRQIMHGFGKRGLAEPDTVEYVSDILTRFSLTRELYAIRSKQGQALEHLIDLQTEWRRAQGWDDGIANRVRQRQVLRHIGEYSLFMSGIFRDRLVSRGQLSYYIANGSSAFWHCADHEHHNSKRHLLFRRLYYNFTNIANALDIMRSNNFASRPLPALIDPGNSLWWL